MRLFARSLICFFFIVLCLIFFASSAFAFTTPFRNANIVTTDPLQINPTPYTDLANCSATDGLTCNRAMATFYGNLYFRDFGTYTDFGMPRGSVINKIRIRITGKTSASSGVGLSSGITYSAPCQFPVDMWIASKLTGQTIKVHEFVAELAPVKQVPGTVHASCLQYYDFENKNFTLKVGRNSSQAWSANIDNFEIAFDYNLPITPTPTPILTPTPTPTPTPIPIPAKTPLILIPGIGGSELKTIEMRIWSEDNGHGGTFNYLYPKNETVWLNEAKAKDFGNDDYFDILRMKADGATSEANIGIADSLVARTYQGAIDFFTANGYILSKDIFIFPYDWRKDISLTAPLLDQKIQQIKTQTGSAKVDIVAHSMGGLVARNYIADAGKASNVRKLFTLGTPHLGAVNSLKALKYGDCLTIRQLKDFPVCIGLNPLETKDVVQSMISMYELTPSQSYFNFYSGEDSSHPYPYKTELGSLNYSQIKTLLTGLSYNTSLFSPSENFHNLDNSLSNTNGVDVVVIAGSGKNTLGQIIEEKTKKDIMNVNGDGTVPLFSASLIDSGKNKSLLGNAKVFYANQEHGDLVASGSALALVKNILENNNQLPDGVSTKAYALPKGWLFSVHSPVNINIYDSSGNHTGPIADGFETNIPGSSYDILDDAKFVFVPDDGSYSIKFAATDQGSFDFKIRKYENDAISQEILYKDIPLTTVTKAETQFNTFSGQSPIVYLDEDGNGTTDQEIDSFAAPTATSTPTPSPTFTPTPTSTPIPTPTQIVIAKSNEELIENESNSVLNQITDVAGAADMDTDIINDSDRERQDALAVLALGIVIVPQLLNQATALFFLKKFW